jgi:hypothetical protein
MKMPDTCASLFDHTDDLIVTTKTIGTKLIREVLMRHPTMEKLIRSQTDILINDWESGKDLYDGLIYIIFTLDSDRPIPLYIGKTETIGKGNRNLSANIKNLHRDTSKFARWGDNYAYHIGDLSAVVLPGHQESKVTNKYTKWAQALFVEFPSDTPQLKQELFFWTTAWKKSDVGPWEAFGPTRLTFLEYLLIGIASSVFPESLLNSEGQNRG